MDNSGPVRNAESALSRLTINANSLGSPGPFLVPNYVHTNPLHYHNWQPPHSSVLPFVSQPSPIPSEYATPLCLINCEKAHPAQKGSVILQEATETIRYQLLWCHEDHIWLSICLLPYVFPPLVSLLNCIRIDDQRY
jgi:hypothetical protein